VKVCGFVFVPSSNPQHDLCAIFLMTKIFSSRLIFSGRPGGPAFYISTVNNVQNHGPASQGSGTEADSCFGKIEPQSIAVKF